MKEIVVVRNTADEDVDEHRREMNERKVAEKEEAERQHKEAEAKAKKAEEDFKKNRQKYEKEEEMLRKKEEEEEQKEMAAEDTMSDEQDTVELRSADLRTINVDVTKVSWTTVNIIASSTYVNDFDCIVNQELHHSYWLDTRVIWFDSKCQSDNSDIIEHVYMYSKCQCICLARFC